MATVGSLNIDITAATAEFKRDLDRASGMLGKFGKDSEGVLKRLKQGLGGRSDFKEIFELMRGTGAVVGLKLAADTLKDMTGKMVELRDLFNDSSKSAGQMAEELIAVVPILGDIRQAGLNIRELFTGEQAAIKAITDSANRVNSALDAQKNFMQFVKEMTGENSPLSKRQQAEEKITAEIKKQEEALRKIQKQQAELASPGAAAVAKSLTTSALRRFIPGAQLIAPPRTSGPNASKLAEEAAQIERSISGLRDALARGGGILDSVELDKEREAMRKLNEEFERANELAREAEVDKVLDAMNDAMDRIAREMEDNARRWEYAAQSVFENTRTPAERFQAELARLSEMLNKGLIDWETYSRAVDAASMALERANDVGTSLPSIDTSLTAREFRNANGVTNQTSSVIDRLLKDQKDQTKEQRLQRQAQERTNRILTGQEKTSTQPTVVTL